MRVYTATEKTTGRQYLYNQRVIYGRQQYAIPYLPGVWYDKLADAKAYAKAKSRFRYNDEPILELIEA